MAAIGPMSWCNLPPVGSPIVLTGVPAVLPSSAEYRPVWVNSGTAALALALLLARQRRPDIAQPEVILPAYGCPDLIAAAVYAGVQPVLADIGADDPGYDFNVLAEALSSHTIAVVAINFLGISDRLMELRDLLEAWPGVALIEDCAQWFPESVKVSGLSGDAVCFSFGRGKPVSLLGGGALWIRESFAPISAISPHISSAGETGPGLLWKVRAHNFLLNPWCYGLLSRISRLNIGRTVYKPLRVIAAMDRQRLVMLPFNIARYWEGSLGAAQGIHRLVPPAMDLPTRLDGRAGRLLRYPVICENAKQRNALWSELLRKGLGPSAMYRRPMPEIQGVAGLAIVRGQLRGAYRFADRLLTVPVHAGVNMSAVEEIGKIFQNYGC